MIFINRCCFILFAVAICHFPPIFGKNLLKKMDKMQVENDTLAENIKNNDENFTDNDIKNETYFSLNELGLLSDTLSHSSRNLNIENIPDSLIFAELSSDISEAKTITNHFFANIYLELQSYLKTPYAICLLLLILTVFAFLLIKSFLSCLCFLKKILVLIASKFLMKHQEIPKESILNEDNKPCGKSNNFAGDISKNNYMYAFNFLPKTYFFIDQLYKKKDLVHIKRLTLI